MSLGSLIPGSQLVASRFAQSSPVSNCRASGTYCTIGSQLVESYLPLLESGVVIIGLNGITANERFVVNAIGCAVTVVI